MPIRVQPRSLDVRVLALLSAAVLIPTAAWGQLAQPIVTLQFDFSDPGARSLGFGGAFVALADDATAAFANPAGLVQLVEPEISIEGRRASYSTPYTEGGRVAGDPSGFGLDSTAGLRTARSDDVVSVLSFFSFAYPRGKWSIAFFRHQLSDFEFFGETQGLFGGGTDCCQIRFLDQRTVNDFDFVSYGAAGAYRVTEALSLGFGATYLDASLTAATEAFGTDDDTLESIFGPNSYLPERMVIGTRALIDDGDWSLTGGILWRVSQRWNIGGVYRQGPEVDGRSELVAGTLVDFGVPPGEVLSRSTARVQFPAVYGLGFAYRAPGDRLTVSFQWDHIEYSSIVESLDLQVSTIEDANELHLGGEYVFQRSTTLIAVRLGAWLDPDHQLRAANTDDPLARALLPPGDDEMHYAAGLGVAFKRFQVDVGVDISNRVDTASISAIYSF